MQTWDGNPVFDPEFKTYFESLKNREKRTGISKQALPMLPKDLTVIMEYLASEPGLTELGETQCLYFQAFASTAFCLWTRCVFCNLIGGSTLIRLTKGMMS